MSEEEPTIIGMFPYCPLLLRDGRVEPVSWRECRFLNLMRKAPEIFKPFLSVMWLYMKIFGVFENVGENVELLFEHPSAFDSSFLSKKGGEENGSE